MIVTLLKSKAEALTTDGGGWVFAHGDEANRNLVADGVQQKTVQLDYPIKATHNYTASGGIEFIYPLSVLFLYQSKLDWTMDQHQEVITICRQAMVEFINAIKNDRANFEELTDGSDLEVQNLFDRNLSGVVFSCKIKLTPADGFC